MIKISQCIFVALMLFSCASPDHGRQETDEYFGISSVDMSLLPETWHSDSSIVMIKVFDQRTDTPVSCYSLEYGSQTMSPVSKVVCIGEYLDTVPPGLYSFAVDGRRRGDCGWWTQRSDVVVLPKRRVELSFVIRIPFKI